MAQDPLASSSLLIISASCSIFTTKDDGIEHTEHFCETKGKGRGLSAYYLFSINDQPAPANYHRAICLLYYYTANQQSSQPSG